METGHLIMCTFKESSKSTRIFRISYWKIFAFDWTVHSSNVMLAVLRQKHTDANLWWPNISNGLLFSLSRFYHTLSLFGLFTWNTNSRHMIRHRHEIVKRSNKLGHFFLDEILHKFSISFRIIWSAFVIWVIPLEFLDDSISLIEIRSVVHS